MELITFAAHMNKKEFGSYVTLVLSSSALSKFGRPLFIIDASFRKCVIPDWKRNTKRFKIAYGTGNSGS